MTNSFNTDWTGIRHVDAMAQIVSHRAVRNARVVEVTNGSIRSAKISGVFQLANHADDPVKTRSGKRQVEVQCLWYGRKPLSTWMHLTLLGECTISENYSGAVVADIGRHT